MPAIKRKKNVPEINAVRDGFRNLAKQLEALSEKLKVPHLFDGLPELWESLEKLRDYEVQDMTETFATVAHEPSLANSRRLRAGANITLTDEGPQKDLVIAGEAGGAAECPIIDQLTSLCEWDDFISGGMPPASMQYFFGGYPYSTFSRIFNPNLTYTEDFGAGSSSAVDPVDATLFQNIGARNGVIKLGDASCSFSYLERDGATGVSGIELSGGVASDDIIEYQSAQEPRVSVDATTNSPLLLRIQFNIPQANNVTWPQDIQDIDAIVGEWIWRIGLTGDAILSGDPPTDGIYFEKTAGMTKPDSQWWGVCRSAGVETRTSEPASFVTSGINSFLIRNYIPGNGLIGFSVSPGTAPENQQEYYVSSNVPFMGMNVFVQCVPKDAAQDTVFDLMKFDVDQSPAQNGALTPDSVIGGIGKLNWTAVFLDERNFFGSYGYVSYERQYLTELDNSARHPGILRMQIAAEPEGLDTPDKMGVATVFYPFSGPTQIYPEMGNEFEPWVGNWKKRFIIHAGQENFDSWAYQQSFLVGLCTPQSPPAPPLISGGAPNMSGIMVFYVSQLDNGTSHFHFYNDMTPGADDDIDTGIEAYDIAGNDPTPFFVLDIEKADGSDIITATVRDAAGEILAQVTSLVDSSFWGTDNINYPLGPFYSAEGQLGNSPNQGGLMTDAYGTKQDTLRGVAA